MTKEKKRTKEQGGRESLKPGTEKGHETKKGGLGGRKNARGNSVTWERNWGKENQAKGRSHG